MKFPPLATLFALPVRRLLVLALCCSCFALFKAEVQADPLPDHKCDTAHPHYANNGVDPAPCVNAGGGSTKIESNGRPYFNCTSGTAGQQCCQVRATIGDFYKWYRLPDCPDINNTPGLRRSAWGTRPETVWSCKWTGTQNGSPCS